jgi:GNAT superfamily N-acetyltransferase
VTSPRGKAPDRRSCERFAQPVIRRASEHDLAAIEQLVASIASEVYGHLFQGAPPRPEGNWAQGLLAKQGDLIIGVMVADDDWIEDLWVASDFRGQGLGSRLLAAGERQIAEGGHELGYLRVIAENQDARRFYARHGWSEAAIYPHERWGFGMIDMIKRLPSNPAGERG